MNIVIQYFVCCIAYYICALLSFKTPHLYSVEYQEQTDVINAALVVIADAAQFTNVCIIVVVNDASTILHWLHASSDFHRHSFAVSAHYYFYIIIFIILDYNIHVFLLVSMGHAA